MLRACLKGGFNGEHPIDVPHEARDVHGARELIARGSRPSTGPTAPPPPTGIQEIEGATPFGSTIAPQRFGHHS
jgi:hypothetical protein